MILSNGNRSIATSPVFYVCCVRAFYPYLFCHYHLSFSLGHFCCCCILIISMEWFSCFIWYDMLLLVFHSLVRHNIAGVIVVICSSVANPSNMSSFRSKSKAYTFWRYTFILLSMQLCSFYGYCQNHKPCGSAPTILMLLVFADKVPWQAQIIFV